MNIIVISHMYPRKYFVDSGIFVEKLVQAMNLKAAESICVISPVPWSPRLLWFKRKWKEYGGAEKETTRDGIKVYYPRYFAVPGKLFSPFQGISMYFSVRSLVKKLIKTNRQQTILHAHAVLPDGLSGILLKRKFNIPVICTIHGSDISINPLKSRLHYAMTVFAAKGCNHICTVSHKLEAILKSMVGEVNNISVIGNGADAERFKVMSREEARRQLGIREKGKIILFVGDLIPIKGVNYLIEAFAKLRGGSAGEDIALHLVGDGSEKDKLILLATNREIQNKVFFEGKRPHNEIPLWLNSADMFVLPSLSEGFPTVIPEAMMCGTPIIATDVGGIPEIIIDGTTGQLVQPRDVCSLTEAIQTYLNDEDLTHFVKKNALKGAQDFTWGKIAEQYNHLYKVLLTGHN